MSSQAAGPPHLVLPNSWGKAASSTKTLENLNSKDFDSFDLCLLSIRWPGPGSWRMQDKPQEPTPLFPQHESWLKVL